MGRDVRGPFILGCRSHEGQRARVNRTLTRERRAHRESLMLIARSPTDCDRLFATNVAAGDLAGLLSLYEPTACLVQRDGTVAHGHDALRTVLASLVAHRTEMRMEIRRVIDGGDIAA